MTSSQRLVVQVASQDDARIRYINPYGIISTVAGIGGGGFGGDGGLAVDAALSDPSMGGDDGVGGWLIADAGNFEVRGW